MRGSALEGRSVVLGMAEGFGLSVAGLDAAFPNWEAHMRSGSCASSKAFFRWARGEGSILRSNVVSDGRSCDLLQLLRAKLPEVAHRCGHVVWLALDHSRPMDDDRASSALGKLPPNLVDLVYSREYSAMRYHHDSEGWRTVIRSFSGDVAVADALAALLIWTRWHIESPSQVLGVMAKPALIESVLTMWRLLSAFMATGWVYPDDQEFVVYAATLLPRMKFHRRLVEESGSAGVDATEQQSEPTNAREEEFGGSDDTHRPPGSLH